MTSILRSFLMAVVCLLGMVMPLGAAAQAPVRLVVTHAYLFTMAPSQREPFTGYIAVGADGRIAAVGKGEPPASLKTTTVLDAKGHWVIPGFISAHSHLWQAAYRGLAADKTLLGWIDELYGRQVVHATDEDLYWFTLEGGLDHLLHGVTAAYNFNYSGHTRAGKELFSEQVFRGEMESGIRFVHGWEPGKVSETHTLEVAREQLKTFLDWTATQTAMNKEPQARDRLLSVMINGGTAFDGTAKQAVMEAALMKEFNLGNQSHYLEQPETQVEDREKIWPWFTDAGLVNNRMIFGHFIHTDAAIVATTAKAGAAMAWNPLSNGRLASGVADIPAYLKAGVRVGMGVDGEASADLADPFENMRTGLYAIRDKYENAGVMSPYDVLRLHTMGSADVLGVADKLGSLEMGKMGDFLVIDPGELGHVFDPYATLVFVTSQPDIERVYVGGELVVERGKLVKQDLGRVEREVKERVAARSVK
ncbi:amidohydrolase family protein [Edaphobacter bradus]|uniref:amidohydrolase family protein n=1 Tax=Edaphobacter bradus TaxID=2259016 RepID=UPI0021E0B25C|nr:amidohydrolase family protein [Edaphobacter bradus]